MKYSIITLLITVLVFAGCLDRVIFVDDAEVIVHITTQEEPAEPLNIDVDDTVKIEFKRQWLWVSKGSHTESLYFYVHIDEIVDDDIMLTCDILQVTATTPAKLRFNLRESILIEDPLEIDQSDIPIGTLNPTEQVLFENVFDCSPVIHTTGRYRLTISIEFESLEPIGQEWMLYKMSLSNVYGKIDDFPNYGRHGAPRYWWD